MKSREAEAYKNSTTKAVWLWNCRLINAMKGANYMNVVGTDNWKAICGAFGDVQEVNRIQRLKKTDIEGVISGYYGNTQVLRDGNGRIVELIKYRPDHTMSLWKRGVWLEARWLINNGQDSSKVFHTFEINGKPASWRHAFAPNKSIGDMWINPETEAGIPVHNGGLAVYSEGNKLLTEVVNQEPGAYFSLEQGELPAPAYSGEKFDFKEENLETVGDKFDAAMEGYYDNTFYFRDTDGAIIEAIYYNRDHTHRAWRNGRWTEGRFLLNNGQNNTSLIQSRADMFNKPAGWCHPFAPYKKEGDMWVAPENHFNGDAVYPLTGAGVPVISQHGKNVVVGTELVPREFYRITRGYVSLEELQARKL